MRTTLTLLTACLMAACGGPTDGSAADTEQADLDLGTMQRRIQGDFTLASRPPADTIDCASAPFKTANFDGRSGTIHLDDPLDPTLTQDFDGHSKGTLVACTQGDTVMKESPVEELYQIQLSTETGKPLLELFDAQGNFQGEFHLAFTRKGINLGANQYNRVQ
jgi:hypothetical protein